MTKLITWHQENSENLVQKIYGLILQKFTTSYQNLQKIRHSGNGIRRDTKGEGTGDKRWMTKLITWHQENSEDLVQKF